MCVINTQFWKWVLVINHSIIKYEVSASILKSNLDLLNNYGDIANLIVRIAYVTLA